VSQTKVGSAAEAGANIAVGFGVNWCANLVVLPLFGLRITGHQAFLMGLVFTAISLVRSYALRRLFNGMRWGYTNAAG
jgi:uncharacterized membrane protein